MSEVIPFRAVSLHDQVAERLRSLIFDRQLAPGEFIDENVWAERWQLEPSLRLYQQSGPNGVKTSRWAPGLRVSWRGGEKWVLESDLNVESSRTRSAQQNENATRLYYSLGYRLDF